MYQDKRFSLVNAPLSAMAIVSGSQQYPSIRGNVKFYDTPYGVLVSAYFEGLPTSAPPCGDGIFAFHIHDGTSCTGNGSDPFADAGSHYNPKNKPHPCHSGDLPPLFGNDGIGYLSFLTKRFSIDEVIGKVLVLHGGPDDFSTQPSGNAGSKIACGVIRSVKRT